MDEEVKKTIIDELKFTARKRATSRRTETNGRRSSFRDWKLIIAGKGETTLLRPKRKNLPEENLDEQSDASGSNVFRP